jgi:F-type H+-transporting ATPase subunit b
VGIDWFTFGAQIVNFAILIGLLWHFAYKPIIRVMDKREATIRERLDEAERTRKEADRKARRLDEKHEDLEAQREDLLAQAREDAEKRRKELIAEARKRVEQSEAEWRASLQRQKQELADELQRRAARHVVAAAQRLVRDMADANLESRMVDVFEKRLGDVDESTSEALREALGETDGQVKIVSAFELADSQREQLRKRLSALADGDTEPSFETDDRLLCGVELRVGDQRVAWSARDYLAELYDRIETAISSAAEREPEEHRTEADATATEESDGGERGEKGE